jgi:hypothetical protein
VIQKIWFPCTYLQTNVVLTPERRLHILEEHPEILKNSDDLIAEALSQPHQIRLRPLGSLLFVSQARTLYVVVAVNKLKREQVYKVMTAYYARKLSREDKVLWERSK